MKDGDLRTIFRIRFKNYQWSSVETAGTASGVPDSEFCTPNGVQGWIEFKQTHIHQVGIRPFQVAWLMRGDQAQALFDGGLECVYATRWEGGPNNWNFQEISNKLQNPIPPPLNIKIQGLAS